MGHQREDSLDLEKFSFFQELKKLEFVDEIFLFGSRSRQEATQRADIDLALVCPGATDSQWNKVLEIIEKADTLLEIDCVRFDAIQSSRFREEILKDHIVVFDRGKK